MKMAACTRGSRRKQFSTISLNSLQSETGRTLLRIVSRHFPSPSNSVTSWLASSSNDTLGEAIHLFLMQS